jgi:TolB protein
LKFVASKSRFFMSVFILFLIPPLKGDRRMTSVTNELVSDSLIVPGEKHFHNMKMLTNGGENAEAYFSFDNSKLIFQSTRNEYPCDQIYMMNTGGSNVHMVSNGKGRTTCSYFFPDGKHILYSSTYLSADTCPPKPDMSKGYVWALYDYNIFTADIDGSNIKQLSHENCYNAESTISPKGDRIIFTSTRDGDIELYSMDLDGTNIKRLTYELGYDGGAYYSYDGSIICFRASRPKTEQEIKEYKELLAEGLVKPTSLDIYVMNTDGSDMRQITNNGKANFCPYFFPDGKRVIFASNMDDPKGRNFDLYSVNIDGTGLEKLTYNDTFDAFPMFSFDGKKLVFCSNRSDTRLGETNVFICDWVE